MSTRKEHTQGKRRTKSANQTREEGREHASRTNLVEGDDGQGGSTRSTLLVDSLVVLDRLPVVPGGGDDNGGSSGKQTLEDFDSDGSLSDSRQESILALEAERSR